MGLPVHPSVRIVEVGKAFELEEALLEFDLDLDDDGVEERVPDPSLRLGFRVCFSYSDSIDLMVLSFSGSRGGTTFAESCRDNC